MQFGGVEIPGEVGRLDPGLQDLPRTRKIPTLCLVGAATVPSRLLTNTVSPPRRWGESYRGGKEDELLNIQMGRRLLLGQREVFIE